MAQTPSTPFSFPFSRTGFAPSTPANASNPLAATPSSAGSSTNTFLMSTSPVKARRGSSEGYRPRVIRTIGQKPACLVNASVTYCGDNQIYAFGGFDRWTDEVYNHVLKLDLTTLQWSLVDNYGDIPGVRMGHTATLWQGDKLLVFGGENEHRTFLSDVVILDLKTLYWTLPEISGPTPRGRARHAATIYDDKLFVVGGLAGPNLLLDDICYLDLKTWTWSKSWRFVGRYDHTTWIWGGRLWVFGGMGEEMERNGEIWWLDMKGSPAFETQSTSNVEEQTLTGRSEQNSRYGSSQAQQPTGGYLANSRATPRPASTPTLYNSAIPPGTVSSLKFVSGPSLPPQASGSHFHVFSSGALLDFVTPASTIRSSECCLSALELDTLRWQTLAEGSDIFSQGYRWQYCAMNEDGTKAWLLGCATEPPPGGAPSMMDEFLSDVLPIDLKKFGLLGNHMASQQHADRSQLPASDRNGRSDLTGLGADLVGMFDKPPETGSGVDFMVTAERDSQDAPPGEGAFGPAPDAVDSTQSFAATNQPTSPPIHVHKLILQARWPHFSRLYASQMAEFHTKKMHIPEPYSVVRAFLYYLYTDSITPHPEFCADLGDVAGLLVMANIYDMPRLRLLCINRLSRELDIDHAAIIWERAGTANEEWLRKRAARFCLAHWGRIVRTAAFKRLSRQSLLELCEESDHDSKLITGEEMEAISELKFAGSWYGRKPNEGLNSGTGILLGEEMEDGDGEQEEGMEMN
ncbi:hypothetical protein L228DRAFT_247571 [Xylona heveae TC161]|uniref:BTB domain-containing protein n=1 Tax=Xylona heveae (strain CBS 132557 / TC161) TaxID=1328760 RepID=A0A165GAV2_XYLHT|nr:hypothetical protein L228DRAFT_247571 [Xylona heveae TC161]KZF21961.1 hypothetical protein L228DRAFT_247571 [Xylona heveae TC161]